MRSIPTGQDSVKQTRIVLEHCGLINAESVREYLARGSSAFEKVLFDMSGVWGLA